MDRAAEYLKRAAEAEAKARQVRDPDIKRQFLELAASWRQLAGLVDRTRR
jgi:hypothetical protein